MVYMGLCNFMDSKKTSFALYDFLISCFSKTGGLFDLIVGILSWQVLMNLTNDNPLGCKQIASSGALETLSTLLACHFPSFCSYLPRISEMEENSLHVEHHNQNDRPLTDPELDFLVAILGLLVNLVEKDEHNRLMHLLCIQCSGLESRIEVIFLPFLYS